MKIMLGNENEPSLLVEVIDSKVNEAGNFDFMVINGGWKGSYNNGHITVWNPPSGSYSSLDITEILTDNQVRLCGDYHEVFNNFKNPNYAPAKLEKIIDFNDDTIVF